MSAPAPSGEPEAGVPTRAEPQGSAVPVDGETAPQENRDAGAVMVGGSDGSTEKTVAALVTWLVGAALTAGSATYLAGGADRGGSSHPGMDPVPPMPTPTPLPEPKPDPVPDPKPEPKPDPVPVPDPEANPDPTPDPKPEPLPDPVPDPKPDPKPEASPELTTPVQPPTLKLINDTGKVGDLITRDARIDVSGLGIDATWKYSVDGVHWTKGQGSEIAASAFGGDGVKHLWVEQTDVAGKVSDTAELTFTLDTAAAAPEASVHSAARDHFPARDAKGDFYVSNRVNTHTWLQVETEVGATWSYSVDRLDYQPGQGDRLALAGWSEGSHEIRIRQRDVAGNESVDSVLKLTVDNAAPSATGVWTAKPAVPNFGWALQTDEDAQIVLVPVGTLNDGTAQGYLEHGRASRSLIVPAKGEGWNWFRGDDEMYMALALDRAGNASFVSLRGATTPDGLSVHALEGRRSSTPPDMNIADVAFDPQRQVWTAEATRDKTDHLFGSDNLDHFVWSMVSNRTTSNNQIDWIHGYDRQQGDVIEINDRAFQTLDASVASDVARYFRKEVLADGTVSLWIDRDGLGQTSRSTDGPSFDQQILVSATHGTELAIHLANGGSFVL